ncbi:hypothetical protein [Pedobacter glucosidilyticus]|uniref:hypothetical protein n=1 Tax=Pedobacter glucosidilyticus TaxID=1122941 RepID=UPI0026EF8865|nr:hypothetical protein [Pedobacter glucosidilyticus]
MKKILVFKTSVEKELVPTVNEVLKGLMDESGNWNFDLEDCDRILRVETTLLEALDIAQGLENMGLYCRELD